MEALIEKIRTLSAERLIEVEDFVDFVRLRDRERKLTNATAALSAPAFAAIWDNSEDGEYNVL